MTYVKLLFSAVLIALVLIFAMENAQTVEIRFLAWAVAMPRALMIVVVFGIGLVAGWLLHSFGGRRKR